MRLEAIGIAFTYKWPGGEVHLEPGKPIDLPDERAQRLLSKAPGKVRIVSATFQAGARIAWTRGDGSTQTGRVDLIHVDDAGVSWAFVTLPGESWSAVNLKFLTGPR